MNSAAGGDDQAAPGGAGAAGGTGGSSAAGRPAGSRAQAPRPDNWYADVSFDLPFVVGRPAATADIGHLHGVLAGAGFDLTPGELADVLWLALSGVPDAESADVPAPAAPGAVPGPVPDARAGPGRDAAAPAPPPPAAGRGGAAVPPPAVPEPARSPVYALTGARPGAGATAVRVPGVAGLPNPLSVVRALRPLKRRVSSLHRYELDETATAEAIADTGGLDVVLRPERARWLDLVLAVDDGLSLRVWQDTLAELTHVLGTSGIFRTVRRCGFATTAVNSAVVDGNRTLVLAVTDGVGPAWRSGEALRTLAGWARKAPTAVLQPLPLRLWPGTALPAERMRVRSSRPAPANQVLRAYDPWLPPHLAAPLELPVPVLELGDWSLAPWADLVAAHGGSATLRVVDAAAPPVPLPPAAPAGSATGRLLAFQEAVSPEAYELAAHLSSVDPLTLPVMRVVQSAALPGSSPSCLAEVLLSGVMHADRPLDGFDVFGFAPDIRPLLRMVIPADDARRTIDAVSDFIAPRLGRSHDFPALIASRTGTLALPADGTPFAELPSPALPSGTAPPPPPPSAPSEHPAAEYVVVVREAGGDAVSIGYLVADRLVLTADTGTPPTGATDFHVHVHADLGSHGGWLAARQVASAGAARLLAIHAPRWSSPPLPAVRWGPMPEFGDAYHVTVATTVFWVGRPRPGTSRLNDDPVWEGRLGRRGRLPKAVLLASGDRGDDEGGAATYLLLHGETGHDDARQGLAVFDGGTLVGLVTPTGGHDTVTDVAVSPVVRFLADPAFFVAAGSPEIDRPTPGGIGRRGPASATKTPPTSGLPPRPVGLTLDEEDALLRVERATLPVAGRATGVLVLRGGAGGPAAVAAEFVHRRGPAFAGVMWQVGSVVRVIPAPGALGSVDAPGLIVLDSRARVDMAEAIDRFDDGGALVLALGESAAGRGYQEIRIGPEPDPLADPSTRPLTVTPARPRATPPFSPAPPAPQVPPDPPDDDAGDLREQLIAVLPWLAAPVPFDVLQALWPAELLAGALGRLHSGSVVRVDWTRREVQLDGTAQSGEPRPAGRPLAERMLMAGYGAEVSASATRSRVDETDLTRHVVALSRAVAPGDDNERTAWLFTRASRHLLAAGDGRTGVSLGERGLESAERLHTPRGDSARPLWVGRAELVEVAIASGLDAFAALSSVTVAAYESSAPPDGGALARIQRELAVLYPAMRAGDPNSLPVFQRALDWCMGRFGLYHRLTTDVSAAVDRLHAGGGAG